MKIVSTLLLLMLTVSIATAQSPSFDTYVNPVIPGDHPDPTLTRIGDYFYTTGSSFNPTPKIYRSTDLVHWEVIAQPVSAGWIQYGDAPAGGVWGGHTVLYNGEYWHYFGLGANMWFVKADQVEGPWSNPVALRVPTGLTGLGRDNSIFIDDDGRWYLLIKNGQSVNYILELDETGQPNGDILNLSWLNPAPDLPYGWAEGPVMWKRNGIYYYSFAQHLAGNQYVMWSDTLTDDPEAWSTPKTLFENISDRGSRNFRDPNHNSPAVLLDDGTSWMISHAYLGGINGEWMSHGRQGILNEVVYDDEGVPTALFPSNGAVDAPDLSSSGVPWMVPKSDMFDEPTLDPEWSFLGYTPPSSWSLTEREGWLRLRPHGGQNTVIKNDGEHSWSLITRVEFHPETSAHQAGLWVYNGLETIRAKLFSTVNAEGAPVIRFTYEAAAVDAPNTAGSVVWLKLERLNHNLAGYFSADGRQWTQVGDHMNVIAMDQNQPDFGAFTGNQQGPFVIGKEADFDLYIYRDAYSVTPAQHPANFLGVTKSADFLTRIHDGDWAMYAGVEFGSPTGSSMGQDYVRVPQTLEINAAGTSGGVVEFWIDSLDTGRKIAEAVLEPTGGITTYETTTVSVDSVSGRHDLYLRFTGDGTGELFRLRAFRFVAAPGSSTSVGEVPDLPASYELRQNHPNPFQGSTSIEYVLPEAGYVRLAIYDVTGREVASLVDADLPAGKHTVLFDGSALPAGTYFYRLNGGGQTQTKKLILTR